MQSFGDQLGSSADEGGGNCKFTAANGRLSAAECRTCMGSGCNLSDDELLRLRDVLYDLASVVLDSVLEMSQNPG
jgi:hypothetical protein